MIVPSIDIQDGRAVQLRQGKTFVLDGGDPRERLEEFAVAGEVAIVDLDAALGRGDNTALIEDLVRRAPCRVGGGIRDLDTARRWLDAGAERIVVGTAASVEFCGALPRDRVIAAVDAREGRVVVEGWQRDTGHDVLDRIAELAPVVGGFLLTQVEFEGGLAGFDQDLIERAVARAGHARITAAGGIRSAEEIARLHALGVDAQVGMALYGGSLPLGDAVAAPLRGGVDRLWPTVVVDERGRALGMVWSTRETVARAVAERRGIYWSRSRQEEWRKGDTSGAIQELLRVELDCDADALRFTVRQTGGFCHTGTRTCWGEGFDLGALERILRRRQDTAPEGSGTARLFSDPELLDAKLREEAAELSATRRRDEAVHETADLLYFALVALRRAGGTLEDVEAELRARSRRVSRRPMVRKPEAGR